MKRAIMIAATLALLMPLLGAQEIPDRPEGLTYPALEWSPPDPAVHRIVREGTPSPVLYVVEDPTLPLVTLTVHFRSGTAGDPVAEMGADLLLRGGAAGKAGDDIRRRVDRLGGRLSVSPGRESGSATIQVLSRDLPEAMQVLSDVLLHPDYREEEIERYRKEKQDAWDRRNDRIRDVTHRTFMRLVLGEGHPFAQEATPADFAAIDREKLLAWSSETFRIEPLVVTVAGRVPERDAVVDALFGWFGTKVGSRREALDSPVSPPAKTKVYLLHRPGATQGNVMIGRPAVPRTHPDYVPLDVMNYILGGSGFPSRITKRVRSDEGLAYSVGTRIDTGDHVGGTYRAAFQTRSAMVPYAISLVLGELDRMRREGVTDEELARAKDAISDRLPEQFDTPEDTADSLADLDLSGRPDDWFATYRDRVRAVTKEDVLRVAKQWLIDPARAVILVVGDRDAILAGDPTGAHPEMLADFGEVVEIEAE